jgi:ABC-type nitrate/sulfonate/bicarbonate transport system permease component
VLTLCALVLDTVVGRVEKVLMKWRPQAAESERL